MDQTDTPLDLLCAGCSPRIDESALDLGGDRPLFPHGFNPLHEGREGTMITLTDVLHREQRRTGALSLFGMRNRVARELAARTRVDVAARGLEVHVESWQDFFAEAVLEHMSELWPEFAPQLVSADDEAGHADAPDNVVSLAHFRTGRQCVKPAMVVECELDRQAVAR